MRGRRWLKLRRKMENRRAGLLAVCGEAVFHFPQQRDREIFRLGSGRPTPGSFSLETILHGLLWTFFRSPQQQPLACVRSDVLRGREAAGL